MALRHAQEQKARVLAICNANGSTIPRESDAVLYTHAGPGGRRRLDQGLPRPRSSPATSSGSSWPRCAASKYGDEIAAIVDDLRAAARAGRRRCSTGWSRYATLARDAAPTRTRCSSSAGTSGYPVALEGALKLKELAYIHAEGFAAGELKHGPIALIEEGTPVIVIVPSPRGRESLHDKIVSNIQEIRARGARTIVIAEEGDEDVVPYADHLIRVPRTPTLLRPGGHHRAAAGASPARSPTPAGSTSTSRATSRRASPSSDRASIRSPDRRRPPARSTVRGTSAVREDRSERRSAHGRLTA